MGLTGSSDAIETNTAGLTFPCTTIEFRHRLDLQDIERLLISALFPLCGNSSPGGFLHQPDLSAYSPIQPPLFDPITEHTKRFLDKLNDDLHRHLEDAREVWSGRSGTRSSDAAADAARRNAQVKGLVQGGVGLVHVAQGITVEAFSAPHAHFDFFGKFRGPGPELTCEVLKDLRLREDGTEAPGGRACIQPGDDIEHEAVGPFIDLWNFSTGSYESENKDTALALTLLCRSLVLYEPLIIVSESAQVSTLLALQGPSTIKRIPHIGEPPAPDELSAVSVGWKAWAKASWWAAQGRVVISQYAPGHYALLVMVRHGGSLKYEPAVEKEATHLLALSYRASLVAYRVAAHQAAHRGRPDPGDLDWFRSTLTAIQAELTETGLDAELDTARRTLKTKLEWIQSRRSVSATRRKPEEGEEDLDQGAVFEGPRDSPTRRAQFQRLLKGDTEFRIRGLDGSVSNPARPAFCRTLAEWEIFHLYQPTGVNIIRSAAKARVPRSNLRNTVVPWEERWWQISRKSVQYHKSWVQVHENPTARVIEQATEGSYFPNGIEVITCESCGDVVLPIPDANSWSQSWRHICDSDLQAAKQEHVEVDATRDGCTRDRLFFASQLYWFPELLESVVGSLEAYDLATVLNDIVDGTNGCGDLAKLIPGVFVWDSDCPAVLVAPDSSARWIAINGIALAHALTSGKHPALDAIRRPDTSGLQSIVRAFDASTYDIEVLECLKDGCHYARLTGSLGKRATHHCDVDGRDARGLVKFQGKRIASFDHLPTFIRLGLLSSFFSPMNPVKVTQKTLVWAGAGPQPPPAPRKPSGTAGTKFRDRTTSVTPRRPTTLLSQALDNEQIMKRLIAKSAAPSSSGSQASSGTPPSSAAKSAAPSVSNTSSSSAARSHPRTLTMTLPTGGGANSRQGARPSALLGAARASVTRTPTARAPPAGPARTPHGNIRSPPTQARASSNDSRGSAPATTGSRFVPFARSGPSTRRGATNVPTSAAPTSSHATAHAQTSPLALARARATDQSSVSRSRPPKRSFEPDTNQQSAAKAARHD